MTSRSSTSNSEHGRSNSLPFRSKRQTIVGYGYRFHLFWDDELDLAGKDIRVTVVFERLDGRLIHSGQKEFRVPGGGR